MRKAKMATSAALLLLSVPSVRAFGNLPSECARDEAELTSDRLHTLSEYDVAFRAEHFRGGATSFNLDSFTSKLSPFFAPEASLIVPQGIGVYKGIVDAAEYLAGTFVSVNVGQALTDKAINTSLAIDGDVFTLFGVNPVTIFPLVTQAVQLYPRMEIVVTFVPCDSQMKTYRFVQTPGYETAIRHSAWTATRSTYQGMFDVCAYHEAYCTGEYKQYVSFASCLDYLTALPDVPVGCPSVVPLWGQLQTLQE